MVHGVACSTASSDLEKQARDFASRISHLLNGTVTTGIRVSAVLERSTGDCWVGRGITSKNLSPTAIPLTLGRKPARAYLSVGHVLQLDQEGLHLMNSEATFGLYLDEMMDEMVLHYDYSREPARPTPDSRPYPDAHLQVSGESSAMDELAARAKVARSLSRLHLPVGGKRYRPTLEDLIEFLVVERLVDAHDDWGGAVDQHREDYYETQLKAAVRRNPEAAREALAELDA